MRGPRGLCQIECRSRREPAPRPLGSGVHPRSREGWPSSQIDQRGRWSFDLLAEMAPALARRPLNRAPSGLSPKPGDAANLASRGKLLISTTVSGKKRRFSSVVDSTAASSRSVPAFLLDIPIGRIVRPRPNSVSSINSSFTKTQYLQLFRVNGRFGAGAARAAHYVRVSFPQKKSPEAVLSASMGPVGRWLNFF